METLFVDTSAFYALANKGESSHEEVRHVFENIKKPFITTNFIFAETISLITKRLGKNAAAIFGKGLKSSRRLTIISLTEEYQEKAWELFLNYEDKDFAMITKFSWILNFQLLGEQLHYVFRKFFFFDNTLYFGWNPL